MRCCNMKKISINKITLVGLLAALTVALSFLESLLPPLFMLPPGFKIGISNIAVMFALLYSGLWAGVLLSVIKSIFILIVNGGYAFVLSFVGSIGSVIVMSALIWLFKDKISYGALSVSGAVTHNMMQLICVYLITASASIFYYSPVLIIAAVICGVGVASAVKLTMPIVLKFVK